MKMAANKHKHHQVEKIDLDKLIDTVVHLSKARGERMTSVRRDVIVAMSKLREPQGAYRILAELNKNRVPQLSAMSLYRTLDFLTELGVVIKLQSQNAFALCAAQNHDHNHLMIICDQCGDTRDVEDDAVAKKLHGLASKHGHTLKHQVLELHGVCASCDA